MRDLTKEIGAYAEARNAEKLNKRDALINTIHAHIETIRSRADELDTIFDNGYAASAAGIRLGDVMAAHDYYRTHNFYANAIHHHLGFLMDDGKPWALATVGGGCNGDVAVIYTEGGNVSCCYEGAAYSPPRGKFADVTESLPDLNDKWLAHCEFALKRFIDDIDAFSDAFGLYLLGIINEGR